jgi:hypothetical protein
MIASTVGAARVCVEPSLSGAVRESVQAIDQLRHTRRSESKDEQLGEPAHPDRLDITGRQLPDVFQAAHSATAVVL